MAVHSWKRQPTEHFGDVWFPYADVHLQTRAGHFRRFAFIVDSGAVTSLLRRSAAEAMGLDWQAGKKVSLGGVGGGETVAYVHEIDTRFDEGIQIRVPYAIAETESVPNLLGRNGVFDKLQIDFDASTRQTSITAPWLDDAERAIWEHFADTIDLICTRVRVSNTQSPVDQVFLRFAGRGERLLRTAAGLAKLHQPYIAPLLVRTLFELAAQFEYLMQDPAKYAQDYLDFGHVTKYKCLREILKTATGPIGNSLAQNPRRPEVEQELKAKHDLIRSRFKKPEKGYWPNWYSMSVFDLARTVGLEAEYRLWYAFGCDWAHADPFSEDMKNLFNDSNMMILCYHYYSKILLRVADAKQIVLTDEQREVLKVAGSEFS